MLALQSAAKPEFFERVQQPQYRTDAAGDHSTASTVALICLSVRKSAAIVSVHAVVFQFVWSLFVSSGLVPRSVFMLLFSFHFADRVDGANHALGGGRVLSQTVAGAGSR